MLWVPASKQESWHSHEFIQRLIRHSRALALMLLLAVALACIPHVANAAAMTPSQVVLSDSQRLIHSLSDRRTEFESNPAALHAFVHEEFAHIFDRVYSARLVLGSASRSATDTEVGAFADALGESLMRRYAGSLLKVNPGLNIKVTTETPLREGTIVKVTSQIERSNGTPVQVDYLMRQGVGKWQVFDVMVEGISFVQTLRIMFAEDLRTKSLAQVTEDLRNDWIRVGTVSTNAPSAKLMK